VPCVLFLRAAQACISECRPLEALVACQQVIDPPAWCGSVTTTLYGGRGDPHPLWRSSLGKWDQGDRGDLASLSGEQEET